MSVTCDTLDVSRGGYYAWAARPATPAAAERRAARERLVEQIRAAHAEAGRGLYGSPRVAAVLKAQGVAACENTVARLMRRHGIRAAVPRRYVPRTTDSGHAWRPADDVLNRDFAADRPDAKWCADITYVETDEGWLYLAAVVDLCTRRVVGWSMAPHLRATLCLDALEMAVLHRGLEPGSGGGLVHHSDRGVQYCCDDYQRRLAALGVTVSMSATRASAWTTPRPRACGARSRRNWSTASPAAASPRTSRPGRRSSSTSRSSTIERDCTAR